MLSLSTDQFELAWLAGFIDGEGTITIENRLPGGRLVVRVTNTHLASIEEVARIGGTRKEKWIDQSFSLDGSPNKPLFTVRWFGHRALELIKAVRPYLRTKAAQADVAAEFMVTIRRGSGGYRRITEDETRLRADARDRIRVLNRRGAA